MGADHQDPPARWPHCSAGVGWTGAPLGQTPLAPPQGRLSMGEEPWLDEGMADGMSALKPLSQWSLFLLA